MIPIFYTPLTSASPTKTARKQQYFLAARIFGLCLLGTCCVFQHFLPPILFMRYFPFLFLYFLVCSIIVTGRCSKVCCTCNSTMELFRCKCIFYLKMKREQKGLEQASTHISPFMWNSTTSLSSQSKKGVNK